MGLLSTFLVHLDLGLLTGQARALMIAGSNSYIILLIKQLTIANQGDMEKWGLLRYR